VNDKQRNREHELSAAFSGRSGDWRCRRRGTRLCRRKFPKRTNNAARNSGFNNRHIVIQRRSISAVNVNGNVVERNDSKRHVIGNMGVIEPNDCNRIRQRFPLRRQRWRSRHQSHLSRRRWRAARHSRRASVGKPGTHTIAYPVANSNADRLRGRALGGQDAD